MAMLPPLREYRTFTVDSRRWTGFKPRPDDIVVATYPKCGTTWMQQIVSLLVRRSAEPQALPHNETWLESRLFSTAAAMLERLETLPSPRSIKCHLPLDGIPFHDDVRYIHVARAGLDACMSFHNHCLAFTPAALANQDRVGLADASLARRAPRADADPRVFFNDWIGKGVSAGETDGSPNLSYFNLERTWWAARHRPNVLLAHYNDMKSNLAGEMRRVADFLKLEIDAATWPQLVAAAGFDAMREAGDVLLPNAGKVWDGGAQRFLYKGTNGRWRDVLRPDDIARFDRKLAASVPADCARWLNDGRLPDPDILS